MSQTPPKKIVIIGGSLSGLFSGLVLSRLGHNVTILERTPSNSLQDQGAGMSVSPCIVPLFESIKKLGTSGSPIIDLFNLYNRTNIPYYDESPTGFRILDRMGGVKQDIKLPLVVGTCSWDLLYNILRANFDGGYERGYVPAVEKRDGDGETRYLSGVKFTGVQDLGNDLVRVEYEGPDGKKETLEVNLLIGADGPSSSVRKAVLPECERTYAGYVAWRGNVRESLLSKETLEAIGETVCFYYYKGGHMLT
jgi:2-polyprenyl-6-methoxyphenol hydroxylase-like FAD-dependent oxidoreductase